MLVRQAFRYELAPTAGQRAVLANHAGAARWAWNWGLAVRRKVYRRRGEPVTAVDLHRLLNRLKRTPTFAWLYEVSKCAPQEALRDVDRAYATYWRGRQGGRRVGVPRFRKRGRCPQRFRLTGVIRVEDGAVVLPRIGRVATKEPDRDLNAANNLVALAALAGFDRRGVAGSSPETESACGEGGAGQAGNGLVQLLSAKRERTRISTLTDA